MRLSLKSFKVNLHFYNDINTYINFSRMNTTQNQKKILLDWMKLHPDVARGRLRRKGESKNEMVNIT